MTITELRETDKYVTILQVCDMLQVSRSTMDRYLKLGRFRALRVGKHLRFDPRELEDDLDKLRLSQEALME